MLARRLDKAASFSARVHRTKNRLVAIPADIQHQLGLRRCRNNFIARISIRRGNAGRWNQHYVKLTSDNEFSIPSDVKDIRPGDDVQVKIHYFIRDEAVMPSPAPRGAALLLELVREQRPGWRSDGAENVDDYLEKEAHGS